MISALKSKMPATLSRPRPQQCSICSYRQPRPYRQGPVTHRHSSAREIRILQGVEYSMSNMSYLCPTCQCSHPARLDYGLNVCVSTSQLHNIHHPRDLGVSCPPDTSHVDWVTIPGAKISDLSYAWRLDYHREYRPMRVLLVAGLNDLIQGGSKDTVMEAIKHFQQVIDAQNFYHPGAKNQFAVATLLNPPKLVWFDNNGPPPPGHTNRLVELQQLNDDITRFNTNNGMLYAPRFHSLGVRKTKHWFNDGSWAPFKTHRWEQWRSSEPVHDKLHLVDRMRIRMGQQVVRYFEAEMEREKGPIAFY